MNYIIPFDSNGGTEVLPVESKGNSIIVMPDNPTKDGNVFDGWYWDNNTFANPFTVNSLLDTPLSINITVYAQWSVNSYTLQYVDEDSELLQSTDYEFSADLTEIEVPIVSKVAHTFIVWVQIFPANMPSIISTLRTQYTINKYTITIDSNGGKLENTEIFLEYGTIFYSLPEPRKLGFIFSGWSLESEDMSFPYTLFKNIQILANYMEMLPHELLWNYYTNISLCDKIMVNCLDGYIELLSDEFSTRAIYNKEGAFGSIMI